MTITNFKGREAPKAARSAMETLLFSLDEVSAWKIPPFQRPIRVNDKVRSASEQIKDDGGVIPGVITLGKLPSDKSYYIVDGQHRVEAFKISGLLECIADVRIISFASMAEMADEFVGLNSRLVNMRPDDILRGLESSVPVLKRIREACDFVSYGNIRRGDSASPLVSMALLIKVWSASGEETPSSSTRGRTSAMLAQDMDNNEADKIIVFMQMARAAWGHDPENYRLWSTLNLTMTMWMWRHLVLDRDRTNKKAVVVSPDQFKKCLMSVAADSSYIDWLVGRNMTERERSPCYSRLKALFVKRILDDTGKKVMMPQPSWSTR